MLTRTYVIRIRWKLSAGVENSFDELIIIWYFESETYHHTMLVSILA
jgi:hypothetical protein